MKIIFFLTFVFGCAEGDPFALDRAGDAGHEGDAAMTHADAGFRDADAPGDAHLTTDSGASSSDGGAQSCGADAECIAGQIETDTQSCGACAKGTQSRTRTCGEDCTWGEFGSFSACSDAGDCTPGETRTSASCDRCEVQVCSDACTWDECQLAAGSECAHEAGTNWRCCGSDAWQFCLSSCVWSTQCAACSGCSC